MIIAIHKPKGMTSHDVIDAVRTITGEQKVGHAGTLDPLASGVLIVAIGRESTKRIDSFMKQEKEYRVVIKLGESSSTDDAEGEKTPFVVHTPPTIQEIKDCLSSFLGVTQQIPPTYSAIKQGGVRAWKKVRSGQTITMKPRRVELKKADIIKYEWPFLEIQLTTASGFYVRSLARDLGEKLKTGGYVFDLIRTRVGEYPLEKSITLEELKRSTTL